MRQCALFCGTNMACNVKSTVQKRRLLPFQSCKIKSIISTRLYKAMFCWSLRRSFRLLFYMFPSYFKRIILMKKEDAMLSQRYFINLANSKYCKLCLRKVGFAVYSQHMIVRDKSASEWADRFNVLISHDCCTRHMQYIFYCRRCCQTNNQKKNQSINQNKNKTMTDKKQIEKINNTKMYYLLSWDPLCMMCRLIHILFLHL